MRRVGWLYTIMLSFVILSCSLPAHSDDDDHLLPKPFINSVLYGTAVGLIVGLAVGGGMPGTLRCTSLGFYGGILLGIYIDNQDSKEQATHQSENPFSDSPKVSVTFHF